MNLEEFANSAATVLCFMFTLHLQLHCTLTCSIAKRRIEAYNIEFAEHRVAVFFE
jgi:hypothetical protein